MSCKSMKQDENDQNYKKESTLVVGKKPYGKSRFKSCSFNWGLILKNLPEISIFCTHENS
jgi:hypothetical protein